MKTIAKKAAWMAITDGAAPQHELTCPETSHSVDGATTEEKMFPPTPPPR